MSVVDKSPDTAKNRGEKESAAAAAATKKRRELEAKHISDLKSILGDIGQDNGLLTVGTDQNSNLVLYEEVLDKKGKPTGQRNEVFFWVDPDGIGFRRKYGSDVIKTIKTNFKGNLEVLRKQLFDKDFLSEDDYTTKNETSFNQAILNAARNHTLTQVQSYTIDGKTKFSPFKNWLSGLGSVSKDKDAAGSGYPLQDINLMDRDVVEAIVRDSYSNTTDMSPEEADAFIQQKTDKYMEQIKKGTLTTVKEKDGVTVRETTKAFSEAQVRAELPGMIESELPGATKYKKNFDFLAFLDGMGAPIV
jgi:hypothetical protein